MWKESRLCLRYIFSVQPFALCCPYV